MVKVFLSYARGDDEPFVERLYNDLAAEVDACGKAMFDVWFDRKCMPSRQLTFHHEIRNVITACDRLVLVVGPKAVTSDYVNQEWQFAHFVANKCVVPIVRLDLKPKHGATTNGFGLLPKELSKLHAEDFRRNSQYKAHLRHLVRILSDPLPPVGKLVAVPELPPGFRAQPERLEVLRDLLLADLSRPLVVSGAAARVGVQGMGGIGKSVLANALARHPEVRRAFKDGIFWIAVGQEPNIAELQRWLCAELGGDNRFDNTMVGRERLRDLLRDRDALLILDNVWQRDHAEAFNVIGPTCRILLTTRDVGLVTAMACHENHYEVTLPTQSQAEELLAAAAGSAPADLPSAATEVIAECGKLPLALALCGGMVQGGTCWQDVVAALKDRDLAFLSTDHPAEAQHLNVWVAMNASLCALPKHQRDRFAELAVFALDTGAVDTAIATLWEHTAALSPRDSRKLLAEFARRSLLRLTDIGGETQVPRNRVVLHDLLHSFAQGMAFRRFPGGTGLHKLLIEAYRKNCPHGWPSGPNDGYYFQNLSQHLGMAGFASEAEQLSGSAAWVMSRLWATRDCGIPHLDEVLFGQSPAADDTERRDITVPSCFVVTGAPGTGKTTFALQLMSHLSRWNVKTKFIPCEVPASQVDGLMTRLGIGGTHVEASTCADTQRCELQLLSVVEYPRGVLGKDARMWVEQQMSDKPAVLCIDGFDILRLSRDEVAGLFDEFRKRDVMGVFISECSSSEHTDGRAPESDALLFMADVVVRLGVKETSGYMTRTVSVVKSRHWKQTYGDHEFRIRSQRGEAKGGCYVYPSLHTYVERTPKGRLSYSWTGVETLDWVMAMSGATSRAPDDGFRSDSTIVLRGTSERAVVALGLNVLLGGTWQMTDSEEPTPGGSGAMICFGGDPVSGHLRAPNITKQDFAVELGLTSLKTSDVDRYKDMKQSVQGALRKRLGIRHAGTVAEVFSGLGDDVPSCDVNSYDVSLDGSAGSADRRSVSLRTFLFAPGPISSSRFLLLLQHLVTQRLKGYPSLARVLLWFPGDFDVCFPMLAAEDLFLPTVVHYLRANGILTVACVPNINCRTSLRLSALADFVIPVGRGRQTKM